MDTPTQWVQEAEAAELLAIAKRTLKSMRRDGRLKPGAHYLYATGVQNGPVVYNITAIVQHLAQVTTALASEKKSQKKAAVKRCKAEVETFSDNNLDLLIAEVQS